MADRAGKSPTTGHRLTNAQIDAQIVAARARESEERAAGLRARSARYDPRYERVVLELSNGVALAIPRTSFADWSARPLRSAPQSS